MKRNRLVLIFVLFASYSMISFAQETQQWSDSIKVLTSLLEKNPKSLEYRMRRGEANVALRRWNDAMKDYMEILQINPNHIGALYFRGYVFMQLHRYSSACDDYMKVLEFQSDHKGALEGLALASMYSNHLQDAFDVSNRLVEIYPFEPAAYSVRAQVEEKRGSLELAAEDADKAVRVQSELMKSYGKKAEVNDDLCVYVLQRLSLDRQLGHKNAKSKAVKNLVDNGMTKNLASAVCR